MQNLSRGGAVTIYAIAISQLKRTDFESHVGAPRFSATQRERRSSSLSRSLRQITTTDVCPSERTFVAALVGIKGDRLRLLATEFAGREFAWRQLGLGSVVDFAL
jgi:hypothetical protein